MRAAQGEPMTARCPAWLRLAADRRTYELISDRADIVRQIFADLAAGLGMYSIATRLNKSGVPAFVGNNGWHRSYIAKTLANRAVLGEFQPHIKIDEDRVPDGEPITNYFPPIIPEELFTKPSTEDPKESPAGLALVGKVPAIPTYSPGWRGARTASRRSRSRTKDRAAEAAAISFAATHSGAAAAKRHGGAIRISRLHSLHLLKSLTSKASSTQTRMPKSESGLRANWQRCRANCRQ